MIVKFNESCFLDYSAKVELRRDKYLSLGEVPEYFLDFDNVNALNHVHIMLSYKEGD